MQIFKKKVGDKEWRRASNWIQCKYIYIYIILKDSHEMHIFFVGGGGGSSNLDIDKFRIVSAFLVQTLESRD
jgi:hypothetical protein